MDNKKCCCEQETEEMKYLRLDEVITDYNASPGNLIQILHFAQGLFGCISPELQSYIAEKLNLSDSMVSGVVSFYSFFSSQPKGENTVRVCLGTACYVRGGKKVLSAIKELLGVDVGETTPDGKFTLEVMRCIGACGLAPAILVNETVYKQVSAQKLDRIFKEY